MLLKYVIRSEDISNDHQRVIFISFLLPSSFRDENRGVQGLGFTEKNEQRYRGVS